MRKTLRRMSLRLTALVAFALPLTCSMACAGLKPFPERYLYEYDAKNKVCGQYQIVDQQNLKYEYVKDLPCPSLFGFTSRQIPNVLNWARDAKIYAQEHCH